MKNETKIQESKVDSFIKNPELQTHQISSSKDSPNATVSQYKFIRDNNSFIISENNEEKFLELTKEQIQVKVKEVFMAFSSYSRKEKQFYLPNIHLIKMLRKIKIFDKINHNDVDIILKSLNLHSNNLTIGTFFNFLLKLMVKINPVEFEENPRLFANIFFCQNA